MIVWLVVGICVVANWASRFCQLQTLEWVSKPAATISMIWLAFLASAASSTQKTLVLAGLVLCLVGDLLLMLPRERFVGGLVSFLMAHLLFLAGFILRGEIAPLWATLCLVGAAAGCATITIKKVVPAVRSKERKLLAPVVVYAATILLMGVSSTLGQTAFAPFGAAVFIVSDTTLGYQRFVKASRFVSVAVMVSYHIALLLIVLSLQP